MTIWSDGKFIDDGDFRVSPLDRGLCHGLSLFETLLAVGGKPRLVGEHLARLESGLDRLGVDSVAMDVGGLEKVMVALLAKNGLESGMARIRFTVSFGEGPLNQIDSGRAWAWMTATRAQTAGTTVNMTTAPWRRDTESVLRGLKVGSDAEHLVATDMARREGFGEMLFFNTSDELCEAAMANVFLIRGGKLFTPSLDSGCLAGVTRQLVIELAREKNIRCFEKPLKKSDLKKADGIFLTSSVTGPVRVSMFGSKQFAEQLLFNQVRELWLKAMGIGE